MTTPAFHFDVEACTCADCTAVRTPKPEHHVETLEIEGPASEVDQLREACAHLTRDDLVQRLNVSVEVARFLLAQRHSYVMEYARSENSTGRAASVRAQVLGVAVAGICFEGTEAYRLLLAAHLANQAAIAAEDGHAL